MLILPDATWLPLLGMTLSVWLLFLDTCSFDAFLVCLLLLQLTRSACLICVGQSPCRLTGNTHARAHTHTRTRFLWRATLGGQVTKLDGLPFLVTGEDPRRGKLIGGLQFDRWLLVRPPGVPAHLG
jgi:hypothetical protein